MDKLASTDHPIHQALAARWSPYGFADRPVAVADLCSLLEAARWAASGFNEQPWRFIVATREDTVEFERVLSCLVEANRAWAGAAAVLTLNVVAENYVRNGKPNGSALHDLGQAAANLSIEAAVRGISVHQMGGILPDRARELYAIPAGCRAVTGMAIGYAADPAELPAELAQRDTAARTRHPLAEFVFSGAWGTAAALTD
jgi:nitroreductase